MGIETFDLANDAKLNYIPESKQEELLTLQEVAAEKYGLDKYFSDSLACGGKGPEMAVIPPGVFEMGSTPDEHGHHREESPQHYVTISRPFAIGRYAVTAIEFEKFRQQTHWHLRPELLWAEGKRPVMNIRISDTKLYLKWLSEETGETYRLPTEAEWEYAARAGSVTPFHFGDDVSCREINFDPLSPYKEDRKKNWFMPRCIPMSVSIDVGSKPANLWGLHEVHGNVWEFTDSHWTTSHTNANRDGSASKDINSEWYVTKGGSWFDGAIHARSASRRKRYFDEMDTNLGFRVVRELG